MTQALSAIKHIHQLGYVHRDLKPENLLLSSNDEHGNIKLADFGFATKTREKGLRSVVGTPPYMAPELVILRSGDKKLPGYGKEIDLWSIGIILYILLSGIHPFQIDEEDEMLTNIESGQWEWLGDQWDLVSDGAKDLIKGLIEPDPKIRLTVDQALTHPWIAGSANNSGNLTGAQEKIRKFQARKKLKGAIFSVIATNRLRRALFSLKNHEEGADVDATDRDNGDDEE